MTRPIRTLALLSVLGWLLCACSKAPTMPAPTAAPTASVTCSMPDGPPAAAALASAGDLQARIRQGPLYQAAAKRGPLEACAWRFPEGGALAQSYTFRGGDRLDVQRDASIEYSNESLTLVAPLAESPDMVLQRAERASFGDKGCGIDWQAQAEQALPSAASGSTVASESIRRGQACNCQARVRMNSAGQAIGLMLRSAC